MLAVTALLFLLQLPGVVGPVRGVVLDPTGAPVAGARVALAAAGHAVVEALTQQDGSFTLPAASFSWAVLTVEAPGFSTAVTAVAHGGSPLRIQLTPAGFTENVVISARAEGIRMLLPGSATVLDRDLLAGSAAWTLDDQLRSIPGFSLFRRSSSRAANPTTQGVTLRGLSASGASRTVVLADGVPLNDPFGGWVYWDRLPAASIGRVEVLRGGAGDSHGADAIGGAIRLESSVDTIARIWLDGGTDDSGRVSAYAGRGLGKLQVFGAAEAYSTGGFVIVASESRGSIDVPATSRHAAANAGALLPLPQGIGLELRGSYFSEDRGNGTPLQTNGTLIRQFSARGRGSAGPGVWTAHAFSASQDYDQTFSVVAADRASERPASVQHVDTSSSGGSFEWLQGSARSAWLVSGRFIHVGADYSESSGAGGGATSTAADQETWDLAGQFTCAPTSRLTISTGLRGEIWRADGPLATDDRILLGVFPRASVAWRPSGGLSLRASVLSAYRNPTINELYRPFRVGNVLTQANSDLRPEDSLGFEGAAFFQRRALAARVVTFWTKLSHPVVNATIGTSGPTIVRRRENVGAIRAGGVELETELRATRHLRVRSALARISSRFTEAAALSGLRVPQVPRWHASAGALASWHRATASVDYRFIGDQFDDDRNLFRLESSSVLDARAGWRVRPSLEWFVAVENVFDAQQDVGRTPIRTIGLPRTARVGIRWATTGNARPGPAR